MPRLLAMLLLITSMAMTGANVPIAKVIVAEIPAETLLLLRFALATLVLAFLVRGEPGPALSTLSTRQWGAVAILAAVGSVLFTWFILAGVKRTSGASAGIILSALPAAVAVIGFARGERPSRGEVAMVALAVAGVVLIQSSLAAGSASTADTWLGNLMIVMAVLCEAAFVVVARRISAEVQPLRLSLAVAAASLAMCLIPALPALANFDLNRVSAITWGLFLWYTMTASVLCTVLWYRGVPHVETWAAGLATAAVPVSALATSALYLRETITPAQSLGAVLVLCAIAAGTLSPRRAPATTPPV